MSGRQVTDAQPPSTQGTPLTDTSSPDFTQPPTGPHGTAEQLPRDIPGHDASIGCWIVTAGWAHPAWDQYAVSVVTLDDLPGQLPAVLHRPGATYELIVTALDPEAGTCTAESVLAAWYIPFLSPANVTVQFTARDADHAFELGWFVTEAIVNAVLRPEPDGLMVTREAWARSIARGLNHGKDPHHGALN